MARRRPDIAGNWRGERHRSPSAQLIGGDAPPKDDALRRLVESTEGRERLDVLTFQLWVAIARRSRLLAEKDGLETIAFPPELIEFQAANDSATISEREQEIFAARKSSLENQIDILKKQSSILKSEIRTLDQHRKEIKRSVSFLEEELKNQSSLLDKGLARRLTVISVEKQLTDMQGEYRQSVVSSMKAKKELSDIDKEIFLIKNERRAEISERLISVESEISILLKRIEYQKALLYDSAVSAFAPNNATDGAPESGTAFEYIILRNDPGTGRSIVEGVTENMPIMPGDVLRVLIAR